MRALSHLFQCAQAAPLYAAQNTSRTKFLENFSHVGMRHDTLRRQAGILLPFLDVGV